MENTNTADAATSSLRAFVIMPFGKSKEEEARFRSVYEHFKRILDDFGFEARRSDDIPGSKSILRDIISNISSSELIVADLTSLNANVFYELAIAHSLHKPTILLTQDPLSSLPFDLQQYHVVKYSRDFESMKSAEEALRQGAAAYLDRDSSYFGNPVSEFFGKEVAVLVESDDDELGIYDHFALVESGHHSLRELIQRLTEDQVRMSNELSKAAKDLEKAKSSRSRLAVLRRVAGVLDRSATLLSESSEEYQNELDNQEISIDGIFRDVDLAKSENLAAYKKMVSQMDELSSNLEFAKSGMEELRSSFQSAPSAERRFNRARDRMVAAIGEMFKAIDRHNDIVDRARKLGIQRTQDGSEV